MHWPLLAVPLSLYALAWSRTRRARHALSDYGRSRYLLLLWLGPHAGRRYFSEAGWVEQRKALGFTFLGWLAAVVWILAFAR